LETVQNVLGFNFDNVNIDATDTVISDYILLEHWNHPDDLNWLPTGYEGTTSIITTTDSVAHYEITGDDPSRPGYTGIARWEVIGALPFVITVRIILACR